MTLNFRPKRTNRGGRVEDSDEESHVMRPAMQGGLANHERYSKGSGKQFEGQRLDQIYASDSALCDRVLHPTEWREVAGRDRHRGGKKGGLSDCGSERAVRDGSQLMTMWMLGVHCSVLEDLPHPVILSQITHSGRSQLPCCVRRPRKSLT